MTIFLFILIAFMVIYPISSALWHLRKLKLKGKEMRRRSVKRYERDRAASYQRYLDTNEAWINRMCHDIFNEHGKERSNEKV